MAVIADHRIGGCRGDRDTTTCGLYPVQTYCQPLIKPQLLPLQNIMAGTRHQDWCRVDNTDCMRFLLWRKGRWDRHDTLPSHHKFPLDRDRGRPYRIFKRKQVGWNYKIRDWGISSNPLCFVLPHTPWFSSPTFNGVISQTTVLLGITPVDHLQWQGGVIANGLNMRLPVIESRFSSLYPGKRKEAGWILEYVLALPDNVNDYALWAYNVKSQIMLCNSPITWCCQMKNIFYI